MLTTILAAGVLAKGGDGWWPLWLLFWIALAVAVVWFLWRRKPRGDGLDRARELLAERFAKGELTSDEYRERLEQLNSGFGWLTPRSVSFREDGQAALEWAARYLERVPELPVLARVQPGEIRSRLSASPPEQGEPFSAVLRDLDEILVPGTTHWQHPRYFAYIAATASEPGILAELLAAALNPVAILWRTAPASTELEGLVADWVAQLLGLPAGWHGHIEDSASTSTLAAVIAARHVTGRNVVVCSEHAHSSVDKAARMLGMELRKVPVDEEFRLRPEALDVDDAAVVVASVGTTSTTSVDPVPAVAEACESAGAWLHVDAAYAPLPKRRRQARAL